MISSGRSCLASPTGLVEGAGLDLPDDPRVTTDIVRRFADGTMTAFTDTLAAVGNCIRPIRLVGGSTTLDAATGEVLSEFTSKNAALGAVYVPCGSRRASECPACARVYARDTFEMIRTGVTGGKLVPARVADNPLAFVTLTAPSFGPVHGVRSSGVCRRLRPGVAKSCPHGRPLACGEHHGDGDPLVGAPLCRECYDYRGQVLWQWWAPELWRRFTITLRRELAGALGVTATGLRDVATLQYAKVAEYQRRGVIHFHALIRVDGPRTPDGFAPAPGAVDAGLLRRVVTSAAAAVSYVPAVPDSFTAVRLGFGRQVDVRPVVHARPDDPDAPLSAEQVAGYVAKYATKAAADTLTDGPGWHYHHLRDTCRAVADAAAEQWGYAQDVNPYARLPKWIDGALGFRGHFSSKSRRWSITLGRLRRARQRWAILNRSDRVPDDVRDLEQALFGDEWDEPTLIVGNWSFAGIGWTTLGDEALALAAAARAREYAQQKAGRR